MHPLRALAGELPPRRLDIRFAHGSLTQVKARAYVVGLFQDVDPAGATVAIDRATDGAITDFSRRRMFSSAVGQIFMLPAGRNELRTDYVLFAGLGQFDHFNVQVLEIVAENLARTLVRTDVEEFATIPIGGGTGLQVDVALEHFLQGFLRGLQDADPDQYFRGISICELQLARYRVLRRALERLSSTRFFPGVEFNVREITLPSFHEVAEIPRVGRLGTVETIYLQVRMEHLRLDWRFDCSLLTSGAKATVLVGQRVVRKAALDAHLAELGKTSLAHADIPRFGAELAELILPDDLRAAIKGSRSQHLVVVHDAEASRIPWETLHIEGVSLALRSGISRRYIAAHMSVARWLEERRLNGTLAVLLVVNPTNDLPGAESEGRRIERLFAEAGRIHIQTLRGTEVTRARLLREFQSGKFDLLHYAGHAFFDPKRPERGGLQCSDAVLMGTDLVGLTNLPSLVFFNACESGRVRLPRVRRRNLAARTLRERLARSSGLAEAFLRGGIANYLGTYWPVDDDSAEAFARVFYGSVLAGESLGAAVQKARREVERLGSPDWADYLQYGNVEFSIKKTP